MSSLGENQSKVTSSCSTGTIGWQDASQEVLQSRGFLPWNCSSSRHRKVKSFPTDDSRKSVNLTASLNGKAGRTHIVRQIDLPESKVSKEEVVEAETIVEMLPIVTVGIVDYMEAPRGCWTIENIFVEILATRSKHPSVGTGINLRPSPNSARKAGYRSQEVAGQRPQQHEEVLPGHPYHRPHPDVPASSMPEGLPRGHPR